MNKVKEMLMNLHSSMAWKLKCQLQVTIDDSNPQCDHVHFYSGVFGPSLESSDAVGAWRKKSHGKKINVLYLCIFNRLDG